MTMTFSASNLSQLSSSTQTGNRFQPTSSVNDPSVWEEYVKKATSFDERIIGDWNKIVDVTLVFVGLIMAVLTSFVIDTSQKFQRNPADITNQLLIGIYDQLVAQATNTSLTRIDTVAILTLEKSDYHHAFLCNALLYSSLGLCTVAAALALTAKLWVISYGERTSSDGTLYERAKKRQEAYSGVLAWKMGAAIQSIPLILLIALVVFLFFVHISLWSIQKSIGYGVGTLLTLGVIALGVTSLAAAFIPACPYKSTFSAIIKGIFDRTHKWPKDVLGRIFKSSRDDTESCGWRWGRMIILLISWFASGAVIAWATIKYTSAYYSLVFIPIAITFEYAMKKRVNHNAQKHRLPRLTFWVFILIGSTLAAAGYFRSPERYIIFVILYLVGMLVLIFYGCTASRMSKSLEETAEIDAIIWLLSLETPPKPYLFEKLKACRIVSGPSDCDSKPKTVESYKPKMLESLMPLLSSLIVSARDRPDVDLETYVSFLAYLADFEDEEGSWWRLWEDAMSHPRLENPLLRRLDELAKDQSGNLGMDAREVLRLFGSKVHGKRQLSGDSDTSSTKTFVESAHSYEEMELHSRRKGGYYSVDA